MRYSIYLSKFIPLATLLLGSTLFFYPLQIIVQKNIQFLRQPEATISLPAGWIKVKNSVLPPIKFNKATLGGQGITQLGNTLYQMSKYILPAGVALILIFGLFSLLGCELQRWVERGYDNQQKEK